MKKTDTKKPETKSETKSTAKKPIDLKKIKAAIRETLLTSIKKGN